MLPAANFYREPKIYISKIQFKLINYQQKHLRSQNEAVKENFQICHTHEANAARNFAIMCVLIKSWDLIHKDFQRCILLNSLTFWLWDFFADISRWAFSVVVFLHDYLLENVDVFSSKILYTCNAPNSDCKRQVSLIDSFRSVTINCVYFELMRNFCMNIEDEKKSS